MYDYKYNYVNFIGFWLVDFNDEYICDIIKEMYYYERDMEFKFLYDKDYNMILVRNNFFLIWNKYIYNYVFDYIVENKYIIEIYKNYIIDIYR